jgi:hypothetical protein
MTGLLIVGAIVLFVLWAIYAGWSAPLMKENEDGSWTTLRPERTFSDLFGKKSTLKDLPDFQHTPPSPNPLDELPASLLIDNERMLHIAGIKTASPEKIAEWQNGKRKMEETKSEALMEDLLAKINPNEMQVIAGIKEHDRSKGAGEIAESDFTIKTGKKSANEIVEALMNAAKSNTLTNTEALNEIRERQIRKEIEFKKKMDFEALPFSRLTQDARDQITKIVREDISKQLEGMEIPKAVAEFNDQRLGMEVIKPKRKYTKKKK